MVVDYLLNVYRAEVWFAGPGVGRKGDRREEGGKGE